MSFFPRHALDWRLREPALLRRLSIAVVATGLLAGVVVRAYRWAMLTMGPTSGWAFVVAVVLGRAVILPALATAHLGNYPVRHWLWRAPLFGLLAGLGEAGMSAILIAAGVERLGTEVAHPHDWLSMASEAVFWDTLVVSIFGALLAGVVQLVRLALIKREHREHTVAAIREDHVRQTKEHGVRSGDD